ncbi:MAG TPA: polynucleotide adenylyltransferase, partial [Chloroflexia bacterium]|nr:polynucleotide adenylyltransferase [Chloroflexia bacterium]
QATLDFVTARQEIYPAPGQLPQVTPAGLAADLARRDFTINAMALPLDPAGAGLLDPQGGQADLAAGQIRALHAASFRDDPTRIFRAARYAARFGFTIEPATRAWIGSTQDAEMLDRLTPARLRQEVLRTLAESDPAPALALLQQWGVLRALDPALTWDGAGAADLRCAADPASRLTLLLYRLPAAAQARLSTRLAIDPRPATELATLVAQGGSLPGRRPSAVAALLRPLAPATLELYGCLAPPPIAAVIRRYQQEWQPVRPHLTGADLRALGIPPGPRYRQLLEALRDARLDGALATREDEIAFVHKLLEAES